MKHFKKLICLLSVAAMLFSCVGCDAASLLEQLDFMPALSKDAVLLKLAEYVNGRTPTSADVSMDFTMHADGNTVNILVNGTALVASETDLYGEGQLTVNINDVEATDFAQVYTFAENGKLLTFTHTDNSDRWFKSESLLPEVQPTPSPTPTPVAEGEAAEAEPVLTIPEAYKLFLLEEGIQTLNDKQVYMLTGTLESELFLRFLEDSLHLAALTTRMQALSPSTRDIDLGTLDYTALSADVVVYLDKTDCSPEQVELTINGANRLLSDLLPMLPKQVTTLLPAHVSIDPIRIVFTEIGFDSVIVPTVTEEGRILALQETFNPNQGDGNFALLQYLDAVKFTPPKGFKQSELSSSYATFRNADNTCAIHYELYKNMTTDAFVESVENGLIPAMEAADLIPVSAAEEAIGEYQTHSITSNGVNIFIATRTFGDSLLGIYVEDNTGTPISSVLPPILNTIEAIQVEY